MKMLMNRARRYQPGDRIVHFPTNRPGIVVAVLPDGRRLVAVTGSGRGRVAVPLEVRTRDLRPEVDLIA